MTDIHHSKDPRQADLVAITEYSDSWDMVVVGGGATGLGTALEAASRGYRVLLLEGHDYAKGTSSRSTKLVHGGVRYLAQGNISLVREALFERGLLRKNAPHLVHDLEFVVPAYAWWSEPFYGLGLKMYDLLSGNLSLGSSRLLDKEKTLAKTPTLQQEGLRGGILYHDGQFDDSRLAITLLRTLREYGGHALNAAKVTGLLYNEAGHVSGVTWQDTETGNRYEAHARVVINATGVWVDDIRQMESSDIKPMLSISQGVHIVVDKKFLPAHAAIMIPRTDDGRVLFAVPWHDHVVIGTTDTPVPAAEFEPRAQEQELDFILRTAAQYMDPAPTREDVKSLYVGLRPLVKPADDKDTKAISRDHTIVVSEKGLVTVTGGKWTTYRRMGSDTTDRAAEVAGLPERLSMTQGLRLHGWNEGNEKQGHWRVYGTDAPLIQKEEGADILLHPDLPYTEAEVRWAARMEQARTVEDVLARRTRALLLNARASREAASRVAELLAEELDRSPAWVIEQISEYERLVAGYLPRAL